MSKPKPSRRERNYDSKSDTTQSPQTITAVAIATNLKSKSKWWRLPLLVIVLLSLGLFAAWWGLPKYWETQADRALLSGRLVEADHYFQRLETWRPRSAVAALGQARVARRQGDPSQARALLAIAESRGADKADTQRERTLLKIQSGAAAAMVERLSTLLIESPEFGADILAAYANGFSTIGLHDRALGFVDQWIETSPADANALQLKAEVLEALEKPEEAERSYEAALKLDPSLLTAMRGLARLKLGLDKTAEALQLIEAVVRAEPLDPDARLLRCKMLLELGREGEAVESLRETIRLDDGSYAARHMLATTLEKQGRSAEVVATVLPLLPRFPEDVSLHYFLATAYTELGEMIVADEHLQKHLDGRKRLDELSEWKAELEAKQKVGVVSAEEYLQLINGYLRFQWDEAYPWLEKALEDHPETADVYRAMSDFLRKKGDNRRAKEFERAAALNGR